MFLILFASCSPKNSTSVNNSNQNTINNESNKNEVKDKYYIKFVLNDEIWDEIILSSYKDDLYKYCLNKNNEPKEILEVEWYDENNILVDETYKFNSNATLYGKIITKYALSYLTNNFIYVSYSEKKSVSIPSEYYEKISYLGVSSITLKSLVVDKSYNYTTGILPNKEMIENLLYTSSINYRGELIEINKLSINANSLENILHMNCFSNSTYIKEIEIFGDIEKIESRAFYNLPNLEKVTIYGDVKEIHEEYNYNCNKMSLEVIK